MTYFWFSTMECSQEQSGFQTSGVSFLSDISPAKPQTCPNSPPVGSNGPLISFRQVPQFLIKMKTKVCYLVVIWEIIKSSLVLSEATITSNSSLYSALSVRKLNNVVPYDGKIKLILNVELPFQGQETFPKDYQAFFNTQRSSRRTKRVTPLAGALIMGAGAAIGWAGHHLWSLIWGNDEQVKTAIDEDRETIAVIQKTLHNVTGHIKDMEHDVEASIKRMLEVTRVHTNNSVEVLQDALQYLRYTWYDDSVRACAAGLLPSKLVSPSLLRKQLLEEESTLKNRKLVFAIKIEDLSLYYSLQLVTCLVTPGNFTVILDLPIRRRKNDWEIMQLQHPKFAFQGQVCSISNQGDKLIAKSQNKIVSLSTSQQEYCRMPGGLCLVPEFEQNGLSSTDCVLAILRGSSYEELSKLCSFDCVQTSEIYLLPLDATAVVVTNAELIREDCDGVKTSFKFEKMGAVLLNRKCGCSYEINGRVTVEEALICSESDGTLSVVHVIPNMWKRSESDSISVDPKQNNTINFNWPKEIEVYNATTLKKMDWDDSDSWWWLHPLTWLLHGHSVMIVVIVAILVYVFCRAYRV